MLRAARLVYGLRRAWLRVRRPITLGVRVLVLDESGAVLVIRHSYVADWHLPGGGVRRGETTAQAARRELAEETGLLALGALPLLGLYGRFVDGASDHVAVHVVRHWRGDLLVDGREVLAARFVPAQAPGVALSPGTERRITEFLRGDAPAPLW